MTEEEIRVAPLPSVRRLPAYLRLLYTLQAQGRDVVSCTHIADDLGLVSVQVRKDLAITGIVGKPKVGYQIPELIGAIENFLGWNNTKDAFLIGAGSLGSALLGYEGFKEFNLNVLAGFDINPAKIGNADPWQRDFCDGPTRHFGQANARSDRRAGCADAGGPGKRPT